MRTNVVSSIPQWLSPASYNLTASALAFAYVWVSGS
ncbi:hypothetical protein PC116_g7752 [Phytophthora cactorum]|uniref:Uncharacterized protein n=1 Tax=Phytophthora cactorum TaxID=29920 RepID=A0A329SI56_9STRA|nr:hypothetical protein Pcac1_g26393 [Phytophthora cactorum]KAG3115162.1 hypothetical protein PI125_g5774 [Phytophthora idaei]KAG4244400.1 hypothetical protein PC116_g7752 [Phytophthora cactorum]RAW36457.1 hypothetical protein PC110_g7252 [Phytophthora cactorum]